MGNIAFFLKDGVIVRKSTTSFATKPGERLIVMDEDKAKSTVLIPGMEGMSLFDNPAGFPFRSIESSDILEEYTEPTVTRQDKKVENLLSQLLTVLGTSLPSDLQESLSLLQTQLAAHAQIEEYWARVVYTEGVASVTDGDGFTIEVISDGELKISFEDSFQDTASFGVWVSFETAGVIYNVSPGDSGSTCTIFLNAASDGSPVTEATFSVLVKGRVSYRGAV